MSLDILSAAAFSPSPAAASFEATGALGAGSSPEGRRRGVSYAKPNISASTAPITDLRLELSN
jgi:hypothetical protein